MKRPPVVDVIIPVHRLDRPIDAAVASAQSEVQGIATRVVVVLHNIDLERSARLRLERSATVLDCDDRVPSPSGPRNVGLDAAVSPYVFFLDSDDELEPGCLRRLHDVADAASADVVLPSIRCGRSYIGTPLVASRSTRQLDIVGDQLFLRSHVPALLRRSTLVAEGVRYPEGIRTGEDLVVMSRLFATVPTAMAFDAVYAVSESANDRTSTASLPAADHLAAVRLVLGAEWLSALSPAEQQALVRRILAVNLAGSWRTRVRLGHEPSSEEYAQVRDLALRRSPNALRLLSVRDRVALAFETTPTRIRKLLHMKPFGLAPSSLAGALSRQGPTLSEARSWLVRHRSRRARVG